MLQQPWGCVMVAVGTWLENLNRPGGQFGPKTQEAYEAKLATLAATITRLAPDLLAVQEGSANPKRWWRQRTGAGFRRFAQRIW